MKTRLLKVGQEINKVIAGSLATRAKNPLLAGVTITEVQVSSDLSHAKIFFTHWHQQLVDAQLTDSLNKAAPWLQRQIGQQLSLRIIPKLHFIIDNTPSQSSHIDALLRQIR